MIGMKRSHRLPTYVGAAIGFVAFLFFGLLPGTLYGSHMGLVMVEALFGMHVEPTLFTKFVTGGGMLLGVVTVLFFFLVIGSVLGAFVGLVLRPFVKAADAARLR
jgi:hypothetical protein